jgi:hypothetical protein
MDTYTKGVLTVIAAAMIMLVIQNVIPNAKAQLLNSGGCGLTERTPCYVATAPARPLEIIGATPFPR